MIDNRKGIMLCFFLIVLFLNDVIGTIEAGDVARLFVIPIACVIGIGYCIITEFSGKDIDG
jgi:hypothetical protein